MSKAAVEELPTLSPFLPRGSNIKIRGRHFVDDQHRVLDLRGANVGAASKTPLRPSPPLHRHTETSYVGRPFPIDEADEHWRRLKSWGLTFVRINVTWEALEHAGPGLYDQEYLDYIRKLVQSMEKYGIVAYISIHQDVYSRYTGGSGAPGWTVELAGFELSDDGESLALSGAAFLDGIRGGRLEGERGLWPTGYTKLAAATMNTLFWGGETFAPSFKVPSRADPKKLVNIQRELQDAWLAAIGKLVEAVGDLDSVMGFELMNEPHPGFIGIPSINEWNYNTDLHLGQFPSPLQAFSMGAGHPTSGVPVYTRFFPWPTRKSSSMTGNPSSATAWSTLGPTGGKCPWEREGVWRWSEKGSKPVALIEDYFVKDREGKSVEFYRDFYYPFVKRWGEVVHGAASKRGKGKGKKGEGKGGAMLVEALPNEFCPDWPEESRPRNFVYAPHWYDLNALFKKQFGFMTVNVQGLSRGMFILNALYWGKGVKKNYATQISRIVDEARKKLGEVPIVFGECGIPVDMNNEEGLKTGDFKWHERMLDALLSALEKNMVGFNLWTYNPSNRDDLGDDWNAENFSWYSNHNRDKVLQASDALVNGKPKKDVEDLDAGARLLDVLVRPYAIATAGTPLAAEYDHETANYTFRFRSPPSTETSASHSQITELYLPTRIYKSGDTKFHLSAGGKARWEEDQQRLYIWFEEVGKVDERYQDGKDGLDGVGKVRRVDVWVPSRVKTSGMATGVNFLIALVFVLVAFALHQAWDRPYLS